MEALTIDKEHTALVIIDLQKGIAAMQSMPHPASEVVRNSAMLADAFRKRGMPVFLVHVVSSEKERLNVPSDTQFQRPQSMPQDWAEFVPELGPAQGDIIVTKKQWGAFYGTDLELQLRRRGMTTIVLCGIATNFGVESTARFAYEMGFQQVFAEDAMSARSEEEHRVSVESAFRRMGRVRSTDEILNGLE